MIVINKDKNIITVNGHAGYAPIGFDIVCASVSILVNNLINSVNELTEDTIEYECDDGYIRLKYGNLSEGASLLVDSFFVGIETISTNYPQYVRLEKDNN